MFYLHASYSSVVIEGVLKGSAQHLHCAQAFHSKSRSPDMFVDPSVNMILSSTTIQKRCNISTTRPTTTGAK